MRRMLNTLYVTTDGAYLQKIGESVVVNVKKEVKLRLPIHNLGGIVCFGRVICSPVLLGFCAQRGVAVSFLTPNGRFMAKVHGPTSGNVLLRREQYRRAELAVECVPIARSIVLAKVANCRACLQRAIRDHGEKGDLSRMETVVKNLEQCLRDLRAENDLDRIRGFEGYASKAYFGVFSDMITAQKECFNLEGRTRRPPLDSVNALLSFVYTLLLHDVMSALETVGLDPQVGYLHRFRPGRPSLALDLMEEFRPVLADRLVLSLINLKQVSGRGFTKEEAGGVKMDDETRKVVLTAYQKRKQEEITHPFLEEKIPMGMVYFTQALLMGRCLRGDLDGYPSFFWK
jgi:CRISPR-associated protein Cas1